MICHRRGHCAPWATQHRDARNKGRAPEKHEPTKGTNASALDFRVQAWVQVPENEGQGNIPVDEWFIPAFLGAFPKNNPRRSSRAVRAPGQSIRYWGLGQDETKIGVKFRHPQILSLLFKLGFSSLLTADFKST